MKLQIVCDWCGKEFEKKQSKITTKNFCSRKCLGAYNGFQKRKDRTQNCDCCGKSFERRERHGNRNKHIFCSIECNAKFRKKHVALNCEWCGIKFEKKVSDINRTEHNFCSNQCCINYRRGTGLSGRNAMTNGTYIHRLLAEKYIGRKLLPGEEVHHLDFNHLNNHEENIIVLTRGEHSALHSRKKVRDKDGKFIKSV